MELHPDWLNEDTAEQLLKANKVDKDFLDNRTAVEIVLELGLLSVG